ncbi:hypothetical protein DV515_00013088 [Chloebia gouldiae]|uniref:Uncharacterized protein n=1 Tax=Chloebia gouldiae TaxID=44316 RepID=A0A3L8S373_CHLGU|nr:hypothetical protein DV515_00013088 [Chloebia gouldiae]
MPFLPGEALELLMKKDFGIRILSLGDVRSTPGPCLSTSVTSPVHAEILGSIPTQNSPDLLEMPRDQVVTTPASSRPLSRSQKGAGTVNGEGKTFIAHFSVVFSCLAPWMSREAAGPSVSSTIKGL